VEQHRPFALSANGHVIAVDLGHVPPNISYGNDIPRTISKMERSL
jgi:hypothetical protein